MRINTERQNSLNILKIAASAVIILFPALCCLIGEASLYITAALFCALTGLRIYETGKTYTNPIAVLFATAFVYTLPSSVWAKNSSGHYAYLTAIITVALGSVLFTDYINENKDAEFKTRMKYMISASAFLCSITDIALYLTVYIPDGKKFNFDAVFSWGVCDALFISIGLMCALKLVLIKSRYKKTLLFMAAIMAFSVIMAKSAIVFLFLAIVAVIFFLKDFNEKMCTTVSLASLLAFMGVFIKLTGNRAAFSDAFITGIRNPFGIGGGAFLSAAEFYASGSYSVKNIALLPFIASSSGIIGIIIIVVIIARQLFLAIKKHDFISMLSLEITLFIMLLPCGKSIMPTLIWVALISYNENDKHSKSIPFKKERIKKVLWILSALCIIFTVSAIEAGIKSSADSLCKKGDYTESYLRYKICASINLTDAESCTRAAECIRKAKIVKEHKEEALSLAEKGIRRSKNDARALSEKARIYYACEDYQSAYEAWQETTRKAPHSSVYRVETAKTLYKIIRENPKGSHETKKAYRALVKIANNIKDLDSKKKINDIVDKASEYTKEELHDEGEAES